MIEASVESFNTGDSSKLEKIFKTAIIPIDKYQNLKERLQTTITTLSIDDLDVNKESQYE